MDEKMTESEKKTASVAGEKTPSLEARIPSGSAVVESLTAKVNRSTKIPSLNLHHKLSRSHDNLASVLRKKAMQMSAAVSKKKKANEHAPMAQIERPSAGQALLKARPNTKTIAIPTIHKANSIQNFEKGKSFSKISLRAQSVQNICRIPLPIGTKGSKTPLGPRRSLSAQNMLNNGQRLTRLPQATAVAYNAELLSNFEKEKKSQERRISELIQISENRKADFEKLKFEMKSKTQDMSEMIQSLRSENQQLRDQLNEHGITTAYFTDNDKILLLEHMLSENRNSVDDESLWNSNAANIGDESLNLRRSSMGHSFGNLSSVTTQNPSLQSMDFSNLDRQNSLSVDRGLSEIGIAYLRDRIQQMQETHYSTNEELQATLQELSDLQDNVNELTAEYEKLYDEKSILLESLCTQTEKLENARLQIEHLKALLIQDCGNGDRSENERQLAALIKSAQEEREELMLKQAEFNNALTAFQNENRELQDIVSALRDRAELEESKSRVFQNDKRTLESQICDMKNQNITDQLEIAKYKALVESERQKFAKAGLDSTSENQMKLEETLVQVRKENEEVKDQLNLANQEIAELNNGLLKAKELNSSLSDSFQMAQTNTRIQIKKMESKIEELELERLQLLHKTEVQENDLSQLHLKQKQSVEESKSQATKLHQLEAELTVSRKQVEELKDSLHQQKEQFREEQEDWLQLQKDLQVAVVIANDLKTEMEYNVESINTENQILREKLSSTMKDLNAVRSERDVLRQRELENTSSSSLFTASRIAALRQGRLGSDSNKMSVSDVLVKKIIASSEEHLKGERPPLSPPLPDTLSRLREVRQENCAGTVAGETEAVSVEGGPDVSYSAGSNQMLPVVEEVPGSPCSSTELKHDSVSDAGIAESETSNSANLAGDSPKKSLSGILVNKVQPRKGVFSSENYDKIMLEKTTNGSGLLHSTKLDPLVSLAKQLGGSKRNALLRWCQNRTASYPGIDITNFSSSWNDGLAFCALLHSYLPDTIPFKDLNSQDRKRNFKCAFDAAESIGITTGPDSNILIVTERPDWQAVFSYVASIYKHFEVDAKS